MRKIKEKCFKRHDREGRISGGVSLNKQVRWSYCWGISLKTKSSANPENLSTKVEKKENSFIIEQALNQKEILPFCIAQQIQPYGIRVLTINSN